MSRIEKWLAGVCLACAAGAAALLIVAAFTTESCSERGGRLVLAGMVPVFQLAGKVVVTSQMPIYECEHAQRSK